MKDSIKVFMSILFLVMSSSSMAIPISSPSQLNSGSTIITFEELPSGTSEPVTINNVTFIDNNADVTSGIQSQNWTQYPGIFEGQYFGVGTGDRGFIINFNGDTVSEFGMGVFDPNFTGNILTAYDINNNVLETLTSNVDVEFPVGPVGGFFSTFVGFTRSSSDIAWLELTNVPGDWLAIDTVTFFGSTAIGVPEPTTLALLAIGLVGIGYRRRKLAANARG